MMKAATLPRDARDRRLPPSGRLSYSKSEVASQNGLADRPKSSASSLLRSNGAGSHCRQRASSAKSPNPSRADEALGAGVAIATPPRCSHSSKAPQSKAGWSSECQDRLCAPTTSSRSKSRAASSDGYQTAERKHRLSRSASARGIVAAGVTQKGLPHLPVRAASEQRCKARSCDKYDSKDQVRNDQGVPTANLSATSMRSPSPSMSCDMHGQDTRSTMSSDCLQDSRSPNSTQFQSESSGTKCAMTLPLPGSRQTEETPTPSKSSLCMRRRMSCPGGLRPLRLLTDFTEASSPSAARCVSTPTSPLVMTPASKRAQSPTLLLAQCLQATLRRAEKSNSFSSTNTLVEESAVPDPKKPEQKEIEHLQLHEKIYDRYCWEEVIQEEGDGGKIVICRQKAGDDSSSHDFVMKIKSKVTLRREEYEKLYRNVLVRMLNFPSHPGVVPLKEVLEDTAFYYVIMPRASGGAFFDRLSKDFPNGVIPEPVLRCLMREILEAVGFVHSNAMLHRDIKPDNLVFQEDESSHQPRRIALIDFDHADPSWHQKDSLISKEMICGTLRFNAPETFKGFFSRQSDLYSVGVILYMLMTGKMPYSDDHYQGAREPTRKPPTGHHAAKAAWSATVHQRLGETAVDWHCDPWPNNPLCKSLCKSLLEFHPSNRPETADKALRHPWFQC